MLPATRPVSLGGKKTNHVILISMKVVLLGFWAHFSWLYPSMPQPSSPNLSRPRASPAFISSGTRKASPRLFKVPAMPLSIRSPRATKVLESVTVHPSGDDWFQFIQGLNNAKVYRWAPKYYYPGQGGAWVIDLVMEDRKFSSEGTNEYPKRRRIAARRRSQGVGTPASLFYSSGRPRSGSSEKARRLRW